MLVAITQTSLVYMDETIIYTSLDNLTTIKNLTTGSRRGREKESRSSLGQVLRYSASLSSL